MTEQHNDERPDGERPERERSDDERPDDDRWRLESYVGWLFSSLLILPVRAYQQFISPLFGPTCRFDPTCSEYFIQAVRKYGPVRGAWRGMCRIARCHPFHPGGHDPP